MADAVLDHTVDITDHDIDIHTHNIDIHSHNLTMSGLPDHYTVDIPTFHIEGLPDHYTFSVDKLPKIQIAPTDVSVRLKEFPSVRTHVPADYALTVSFLGWPVFAFSLCGEGQIITEPYVPNPCEHCLPTSGRTAEDDSER